MNDFDIKFNFNISKNTIDILLRYLDIRSQSLGELLTKLERNGFITRTQSEEDKRIVMLQLTDAGREAAEKATEQRMDMDNLFTCLSTEEQETLNTLICRLCENLQEQIGENAEDIPPHHYRHRERAFMNDRFFGRREQFRDNFPEPPHTPEEPPFRR